MFCLGQVIQRHKLPSLFAFICSFSAFAEVPPSRRRGQGKGLVPSGRLRTGLRLFHLTFRTHCFPPFLRAVPHPVPQQTHLPETSHSVPAGAAVTPPCLPHTQASPGRTGAASDSLQAPEP